MGSNSRDLPRHQPAPDCDPPAPHKTRGRERRRDLLHEFAPQHSLCRDPPARPLLPATLRAADHTRVEITEDETKAEVSDMAATPRALIPPRLSAGALKAEAALGS
jgi:hypothetical protein